MPKKKTKAESSPIATNWNPWGVTNRDCEDAKELVMKAIHGEPMNGDPAVIRDHIKLLLQMVSQAQRAPRVVESNNDEPESQLTPTTIGDTPLILDFQQKRA